MLRLFVDILFDFTLYYPLFMAYMWMIGGVYYYIHWERRQSNFDNPPELRSYPRVAIVVPCHNEANNIRDTVQALCELRYPDFEIILVNDGSTDGTREILDGLAAEHANVRVVHFPVNQGKAMALSMGVLVTPCEFVVTVDGDAVLDPHAVTWIMHHFVDSPRVGAVTGNPRIRTRSTLLGKIQIGSAMLKRQKNSEHVFWSG